MAEWKGQGKKTEKAANPDRVSSPFSSPFSPLFFVQPHGYAGLQLDCESEQICCRRCHEIPAHMHANDPRGARPPLPSMSDTRVTSVCGLTASPLSHVRARRQAREGRCARANAAEVRKLAGVTGRCSTRNSFIISWLDYKFIWQGRRTFINIITAIKSGVVNMLG